MNGRMTLRLGGAFQSARRAVVKTFAKPQIGAVPDLQLALAAAVAGPVGGIATPLAQALLAIAAVALFQADAITLALPAVELAVAVAPRAQIDTVMATTKTMRPRCPDQIVAMGSVGQSMTSEGMPRISRIDLPVLADRGAGIDASMIRIPVIGTVIVSIVIGRNHTARQRSNREQCAGPG